MGIHEGWNSYHGLEQWFLITQQRTMEYIYDKAIYFPVFLHGKKNQMVGILFTFSFQGTTI